MQPEAQSAHLKTVAARPLAELLACPPEAGRLLNSAAQCIEYAAGTTVFLQDAPCQGLYVVVSGCFARRAERFHARLSLGSVRPGDLVELAAVLGSGLHSHSLTAQTPGSLLLLPLDDLQRAFDTYPPLRMNLLEELAREVSRAYLARCLSQKSPSSRSASA